ncbi:hypothetical protein BJV74DRAFT_794281 [Russula compacta]|nr:hypothetical protein BJV74DRAFT_794281 [Russula compacta]
MFNHWQVSHGLQVHPLLPLPSFPAWDILFEPYIFVEEVATSISALQDTHRRKENVMKVDANRRLGRARATDSDKSPDDGSPHEHPFDREYQDIGITGDFDASANALCTLCGKEAKNHDEGRVQTMKDGMDGVFSTIPTAFYNQ